MNGRPLCHRRWLQRLELGLGRRLPVVLQTEAAECGLACIAMVAGRYGRHVDLAALRRQFPVSLKGMTLKAVIDIASRVGLEARPLRVELSELRRLRRPCILHWRLDHFVVLKAVRRGRVVIVDPGSGERRMSSDEASHAFTGVALELWPSRRFAPRDERRRVRLRDLIGRVAGLVPALTQALVLAAALEVFALLSPLLLQWTIDHVLVTANRDLLTLLVIAFGALVVLQQLIAVLRAWVVMHFGTSLNVQWHANTFTHLLTLPTAYFEKRHLGDVVSRFRSIDAIQQTLTTAFITAVIDGAMALIVGVVLIVYSPLLASVCGAATLLYALGRGLSYRPLRTATEEQIVHTASQESHFFETVRGVRALKLFGRSHERRAAWLTLLVDQVNAGLRTQKIQIGLGAVNGLVFGLEHIIVIGLAASLVLDGAFSVGMLTAFMAYKGQFSSRIAALIDRFVELKMLRLHGERLADIMLEPAECQGRVQIAASHTAAIAPRIELEELKFRYAEHEPYVLDGVNLVVPAGESVAIVGPSGGGKTTLLHLLLGVLEPSSGRILIGGIDAAHLGADARRRLIGAVTQHDTLFAGSIADNISFFDERPDAKRIEECARLASIHGEIVQMPMGYQTLVGYMGSVLSGGQAQRVLLARALYRRPKILVLDEATSHLDVMREARVNAAVRALNVTRVLVAHRTETAESADRIVTLANGRIMADKRLIMPRAAVPVGQGQAG